MRLVTLASLLPDRALRRLYAWSNKDYSDGIGWNFWMDASYAKYCRKDKRHCRCRDAMYGGRINYGDCPRHPVDW